jgi:hypothetical protein
LGDASLRLSKTVKKNSPERERRAPVSKIKYHYTHICLFQRVKTSLRVGRCFANAQHDGEKDVTMGGVERLCFEDLNVTISLVALSIRKIIRKNCKLSQRFVTFRKQRFIKYGQDQEGEEDFRTRYLCNYL